MWPHNIYKYIHSYRIFISGAGGGALSRQVVLHLEFRKKKKKETWPGIDRGRGNYNRRASKDIPAFGCPQQSTSFFLRCSSALLIDSNDEVDEKKLHGYLALKPEEKYRRHYLLKLGARRPSVSPAAVRIVS